MAKRFTETNKWTEDWFLEMSTENKLFWLYICDNCDHAGIYKPNKRMFELLAGVSVEIQEFLSIVNKDKDRITVLENGRWFLNQFISFQYGNNLNPRNRVHKSIIEVLYKNGITYADSPTPDKLEDKTTNSSSSKSIPDSIEEVISYFKEKGSSKYAAERFYNYYGSNGWKVGKNPMKNWRLAASGWISRDNKESGKRDNGYLGGQLNAIKG